MGEKKSYEIAYVWIILVHCFFYIGLAYDRNPVSMIQL